MSIQNKKIQHIAIRSKEDDIVFLTVDVGISMSDWDKESKDLSTERYNELVDDAISFLKLAKVLKKDMMEKVKEDEDE